MLYWIVPTVAAIFFVGWLAVNRGWTTLPSLGRFTFTTPVWANTWWAANWALLMIFLPLWMVTVLLILPALPIGYGAYASHGGATGWLLVFLVLFLAITFTIPQRWLRLPLGIVFGLLLFWVVAPAILWTAMGYCAPSDRECLHKEAVEVAIKAETQRQRQAAAQRAIDASRQPVAPQCSVQRRPHRYPASKPAVLDNPGGICALALFIKGHCVYYTQNNNDQTGGMICVNNNKKITVRDMSDKPIEMPEDVDRVWSIAEAFDGSIGLWQPRYTKLLSWR